MSRRSKRNKDDGSDRTVGQDGPPEQQENSVAAHVRDRQRAVAEREAARLARPERRSRSVLAHANRKLSAVSSTPFGFLASNSRKSKDEPEQEEWCGPFSVARQMIARREEAKRKREKDLADEQEDHHPLDALMEEMNDQERRKIHPSMQWKSKLPRSGNDGTNADGKVVITSTYAKRQRRVDLAKSDQSRIPSLFELTVRFIVDNFEYVESLGDVGNEVRVAIARELVARNQLDGKAFEALVEPDLMETLEIEDCAGIPQDNMASIISKTKGLRYLLLTHAGRCFGKKTVKALLEKNTDAELCCLSIAGAYLLSDDDAAKLIEAHSSTLQSIAFQACPLLGSKFVNAIHENSRLGETLLELSLQEMSFSADQLATLANSKDSFRKVKSLTLRAISGLTDELLSKILLLVHESLDSLNVGFNYSLTDSTLSSIRNCSRLKTLILDGIKALTAPGLETLFTHPLEGLPPPPKLKVLKLASIDYEAVTDELLKLVTASSSTVATTNPGGGSTISSRFAGHRGLGRTGGLVQLDVQGSTLVTDQMLEQIVETSANTLEVINVSYCPLISDRGLGYLVSRVGNQLKKIEVWGCAQLTDEFFDGHDRVKDGALEIVGTWMKKSGTRSLR